MSGEKTQVEHKSTDPVSHTPGPWTVDDCHFGDKYRYVLSTKSETICRIGLGLFADPDRKTAEVNARLIAAAPDMLALLMDMENWLRPEVVKEPDRTFFWKIVELRRKVEGRERLFDDYPPSQAAVIRDNGDAP